MKTKVTLIILLLLVTITGCQTQAACPECPPIPTAVPTSAPEPTSAPSPIDLKLDHTPRLAIASAFDAELQLLLAEADITNTYVIAGTTYHLGTLRNNDVVMFLSGVSMVNASMKPQVAIDYFNIEAMIFSGIAGGVSPNLNIGDVVIPAQWAQYMESTMAREVNGEYVLPSWMTAEFPNFGMMYPGPVEVVSNTSEPDVYTPQFWFPVDPDMLTIASEIAANTSLNQCAETCLTTTPQIVVGGNGVSGQSFVDNAELRDFAWNVFGADALDMETAAFAQVAYTNNIPYLAFRSLSDLAGGGPGENEIGIFFQIAADNSATVLLAFLESYAAAH